MVNSCVNMLVYRLFKFEVKYKNYYVVLIKICLLLKDIFLNILSGLKVDLVLLYIIY